MTASNDPDAGASTVSTAGSLVTDPRLLLTVTKYPPEFVRLSELKVRLLFVAPAIGTGPLAH